MSKVKNAMIQRKSWFSPYGTKENTHLVGQIFFPYNSFSLDDQDKEVLNRLIEYYKWHVKPKPALVTLPLELAFIGFADHRGKASYNMMLGKKRAQKVRDYVDSWLKQYPYFTSTDSSEGETHAQHRDMSVERRVNIIASRTAKKPEVSGEVVVIWGDAMHKITNEFGFKTVSGGGIGLGPISGQLFTIQIRNLRTSETMHYTYTGGGTGIGVSANRPTGETKITLPVWLRLDDFEGNGKVTSIGIGVDVATILQFNGPMERGRTSKPLEIEISGWDLVVGAEADFLGYWHRR